MAETIDYYNYSQTERIVLLIDLYPLLHLQNPNPYLSFILTASQTLLLFPSLSSSLFAFKLFFSSLSPLLSSPPPPSTASSTNPPPSISPSAAHLKHSILSPKPSFLSLTPQFLLNWRFRRLVPRMWPVLCFRSRTIMPGMHKVKIFQILLCMETLRSEVAESVEASTKRKLVKQICLLLEIIQYLVEGGFHGHLSLYDHVKKNIKMRYHDVLGNVVNKIYAQMDLLPYVDENEYLILLLNSEDSNHSWRDKDRYVTAETNRIHESISAEDESSQPLEHDMDSPCNVKREDHARPLSEAQEMRERARRFVSFTTWVPDLQRVWAPKQPKAMRAKSESLQKQSKRKERHRGNHDIVCETPMMGKKHNESSLSGSVSKALFQDDW